MDAAEISAPGRSRGACGPTGRAGRQARQAEQSPRRGPPLQVLLALFDLAVAFGAAGVLVAHQAAAALVAATIVGAVGARPRSRPFLARAISLGLVLRPLALRGVLGERRLAGEAERGGGEKHGAIARR